MDVRLCIYLYLNTHIPNPRHPQKNTTLYSSTTATIPLATLTSGSRSALPPRRLWPIGAHTALLATEGDVTLLVDLSARQPVWAREEALASVESVGFVDFVPSPSAAAPGGVGGFLVNEKEVCT